jgi:hypothetical protein
MHRRMRDPAMLAHEPAEADRKSTQGAPLVDGFGDGITAEVGEKYSIESIPRPGPVVSTFIPAGHSQKKHQESALEGTGSKFFKGAGAQVFRELQEPVL